MSEHPGGLVYGVAAFRAAARGDRILWALHRAALSNGIVPIVPVSVIADAYRTEARVDRIEGILAGSEIEQMDDATARRVGELAARADTADLAAVVVADAAARHNCAAVSARQTALRNAADLLGHELVLYGL